MIQIPKQLRVRLNRLIVDWHLAEFLVSVQTLPNNRTVTSVYEPLNWTKVGVQAGIMVEWQVPAWDPLFQHEHPVFRLTTLITGCNQPVQAEWNGLPRLKCMAPIPNPFKLSSLTINGHMLKIPWTYNFIPYYPLCTLQPFFPFKWFGTASCCPGLNQAIQA